jgi:glycosyltransferase involved in cell wall biosynthesis
MRILHIVEDFSFSGGGIRTVVKNLSEELKKNSYNSYIITSKKEKEDNVYLVESSDKPWLYSKDWKNKIQTISNQKHIDCIHIHGTWMYPQFIAAKYSSENNIPFILSPHGMYEPWLWEKGTLKKKLYFKYLTKRYFEKASIIHAITVEEKKNLKKIFPKTQLNEIPNLIKSDNNHLETSLNKENYLLYLGRLDEVKGLNILIKSFIKIDPKNIKLKIAGSFNAYKLVLDKIIKESNFDSNKIEFLGFVKNDAKEQLVKNAIAVVAPSYSEVIGMVNLEAAILKTPVITTYQTGLKKEWNKNGGVLINPNFKELNVAIKKVLNWSKEKRNQEGEKLYNFVLKNYTWKNRIKDWLKLYSSIIDGKSN